MRIKDYEYTNSQMQSIIAEHIHSDRDRSILKMCYIDGLTLARASSSPSA